MDAREARQLLHSQRAFFRSGATLPLQARRIALKKLLTALNRWEEPLCAALQKDLGKSPAESYMTELSMVKGEIGHMLRHMKSYAREQRVRTPPAQFVSRSFVKPSPKGCVLIMSPWNYPVLLTLGPLVDALAAGNTAIIKPSAYSPAVSEALAGLIAEVFPPEHAAVVTGGRAENAALLELHFDHIFFTGSQAVGKEVMAKAAVHLTPVTLELGGKSPCIVDETADLALAARRIVFGKFINCGQTCVAPDYLLVHESVRPALLEHLKKEIAAQYGPAPLQDQSYGRIVNRKHFDRLRTLTDPEKVVIGGGYDEAACKIEPTVLDRVTRQDPVMGEEIFGPILPVLTYTDLSAAIAELQELQSPLALYIFSSDRAHIEALKSRLSFGGGCINDTLIHLATSAMGFGGVGESGMGAYHGRRGFETFSHRKSMVDKKTVLDLPMRYRPATPLKNALIRIFAR